MIDNVIHDSHHRSIRAKWECMWVELPDNDLTEVTFKLAMTFVLDRHSFKIEAVENAPVVAVEFPNRSTVTAVMTPAAFFLLLRTQQGMEAIGQEPLYWALVDNSAVDVTTGEAIDLSALPSPFPKLHPTPAG